MYSRLYKCGWKHNYRNISNSQKKCSGVDLKRKEVTSKNIQPDKLINGFLCSQVDHIKEYNMTAYSLVHEKTKTEYLHLDRDDTNNVFSVSFRTTPLDSMGTPHILEHTVLCGSEKYPVRDPFFKMLNRSVATFMNAMTAPDHTFYPFSTQNEIDFKNLQKVYLDAVFKPNLSKLDFLQEGWRLEHSVLGDKKSNLILKGVVYNEMKGVFSEINSLFGQKFLNAILPKGTYSYVSGGDPLQIPELTHDYLKNFHATYYHPSNAKIFSYGNFPLEETLKVLDELYLSKYNYLDPKNTIVLPQERWLTPKTQHITCRVDEFGGPIEKQNQIAIGYILSDNTDVYETFMLTALAELMLVGPNSVFYKSLIEKNISGGYNSITGYENQIRDTLFVVGLRDVDKSNFKLVEDTVKQTIEDLYEKGFEKDHIASVLHGIELKIKHQSPRFGMDLLFNLMPIWNHNGPVFDVLNVNNLLDRLKSDLSNPKYVKEVIEKYFISNNHRLVMTMSPDPKFDEVFNTAESKLLETKVEKLTEKDIDEIYKTGLDLAEAQKAIQNLDILPCLKIDEITLNKTAPTLKHTISGTIPLQLCEANTNGVTYLKAVLGTEFLNEKHLQMLPFFIYILGKFDTKNYNYRDFDKLISMTTSGLAFMSHITEHIDQQNQYEQGILLASHCLDFNLRKMLHIWNEIFERHNFENTERMDMLLKNYCSNLTGGIVHSGHTYAMQAARSLISSIDKCKESLQGIHHIIDMQKIQKKYKIEDVQTIVDNISKEVFKGGNLRAAFHYSNNNDETFEAIDEFCLSLSKDDLNSEVNRINWIDSKEILPENKGLHISMNIPVNYCAKALHTVAYSQPDHAKIRVLSSFLNSKYLHPIVREKNGAYGGGSTLTMDGVFNFYSYRDPNSRVTLDVFDNTDAWLKDNYALIDEQNLFEAKLSVLQQMDKPIAEYMKGIDMFLYGLSYDIWSMQRERVLDVQKEDLIEVCEKYLKSDRRAGRCVIGDGGSQMLQKNDEFWSKISGPQQ